MQEREFENTNLTFLSSQWGCLGGILLLGKLYFVLRVFFWGCLGWGLGFFEVSALHKSWMQHWHFARMFHWAKKRDVKIWCGIRQECGIGWVLRSLPNQIIPGFCDSRSVIWFWMFIKEYKPGFGKKKFKKKIIIYSVWIRTLNCSKWFKTTSQVCSRSFFAGEEELKWQKWDI